MKRVCKWEECDNEFDVFPSWLRQGRTLEYCCLEHKQRATHIWFECPVCGVEHSRTKKRYEKSKHPCCSPECYHTWLVEREEKTCPNCKETKRIEYFPLAGPKHASPDGRGSWCNSCRARNTRQWYRKNKKRVIARNRRVMREQPQKQKAYNKVANEIRAKRMPHFSEKTCVFCDREAQLYHHECYCDNHLLNVTPMCVSHHKLYHSSDSEEWRNRDLSVCVFEEGGRNVARTQNAVLASDAEAISG